MELETCQECKKLFYYVAGERLCPDCRDRSDMLFKKTSEYVREHKSVNIRQITEDCDVSVPQVKKWIREERLHTVDEQEVYSTCESCGIPIPSGHFCNICKNQLISGVKNAMGPDNTVKPDTKKKCASKSGHQMRFVNRNRNI